MPEGWHKPETEKALPGSWHKPQDALTEEQLAVLRESPPPDIPEPLIGTSPSQTGGWYRPATSDGGEPPVDPVMMEVPAEAVSVEEVAPVNPLLEYIAKLNPEDVGQFDPSRSGALQGIQPDLGEFDAAKSGQMAGIGAEEPQEPETPQEPDLGAFDPSRSGALSGIEEPPISTFDDSKSGQLAGIGAEAEAVVETAFQEGDNAAVVDGQAVQGATQIMTDTNAQAQQPQQAQKPDPYAVVEQQVTALRQQFQNGQMTREQLEGELRKLMILDDAGSWWMLGVDSNKWYRYDGVTWNPGEPPRPQVVAGSPIPTETGVQQVVSSQTPVQAQATPQTVDYSAQQNNLPLPAKVPVDDMEATLVGQSAINLDEHRSFEAPTHPGFQAPTAEDTMPSGADGAGAETVPAAGQDAYGYQQGVNGELVGADGQTYDAGAAPAAAYQPRRKMQGIQPDYSEAFGGSLDQAGFRKWGLRLAIFGTVGVLVLALLFVLGFIGFYFSVVGEYSDEINNLGDRAASFESIIVYDSTGNTIAQFNDPTTGARRSVPLEEISPFLIHATVATEDETFYENPGFSVYGIIRAAVRNLQTSGGGGGASTITQQLARAIVLDPEVSAERSAGRKIQEIIIAAELDRKYSKSEILEFYLNEIYYGNLAYGIEAASQTYFQKSAKDLNLAEAAFIAGLPQAPAFYDPVTNRETAVLRMNDVLRLMTEATGDGCIEMQHEPYNTQPFCVTETDIADTHVVEIATVQVMTFQPPRFDVAYPHFVNYVYQELESRFGSQSIFSSGFKVYTTLVPSVQDAAQQAVVDEIAVTPGANNGAVIAIRPRDGAVLAMVGSADFDNEEIDGQVNVLFTPQQPGSSIKPLVYVTSIEGNDPNTYWYPGTIIWDVPTCWGNYCPRNFSGTFLGPVGMRYSLGQSLNIPAIKALEFVTTERFNTMLQRFGVQTPGEDPVVAGLPSAIGGIEIYPFELGLAYATLANNGVRQEPYAISRIEDKNGNIVYQAEEAPAGAQVVRPEYAYLITAMLADDSIKFVPAESIPGWQAAAKTGTTNDNRDVWTAGYTNEVAVAVWVGRTDNQPMSSTVLGTNTAAPIWNKTMTAALAGLSPTTIPVPSGIAQYQVCSVTGAIYNPDTCPGGTAITEVAFSSQPPPQEAFLVTKEVDAFSGFLANENCPEDVELRSFVNITDQSAIDWLNGGGGQAWAAEHNIAVPVVAVPTEACPPGMPRPRLVISQPTSNAQVSGNTVIYGTVSVPGFTSYTFQVASASDPTNFSTPPGEAGHFTEVPQPEAVLGTVDFTSYPNGNYILRLVGNGQNDASISIDVPVVVNNLTPTAQPLVPTTTPAPTLTPPVDGGAVLPPTVAPQ